MGMKGYKAFNRDWTCRGMQYEIGKTYELKEGETLEICKCGFHFCRNPIDVFAYYDDSFNTVIAEIEALGEIQQEGTKCCTDKIRIVKEFTGVELLALIDAGRDNTGIMNTGDHNTGNYNSGDCNTGYFNSGNYNTGKFNSGSFNRGSYNSGSFNTGCNNKGDRNSGDDNRGNSNSGDFNSGNFNSGSFNRGICNSGSFNRGSYNSGRFNSGNHNTGKFNSGDCNSGDFNSGNYNSGIFNTDEPKLRMFNKACNMTLSEFQRSLGYNLADLFQRIYGKKLIDGDREKIEALPNYDPVIFKEITGIDLKEES